MTRHPCTGPIISKEALERIRKILDASEKAGVTFDLDGRVISVAGYEQGNFIGRTILSGVKEDMPCYTQKNIWPSFVLHRGREAGRGHYPRESQHDGQRRRTLHNKWWSSAQIRARNRGRSDWHQCPRFSTAALLLLELIKGLNSGRLASQLLPFTLK